MKEGQPPKRFILTASADRGEDLLLQRLFLVHSVKCVAILTPEW